LCSRDGSRVDSTGDGVLRVSAPQRIGDDALAETGVLLHGQSRSSDRGEADAASTGAGSAPSDDWAGRGASSVVAAGPLGVRGVVDAGGVVSSSDVETGRAWES